MTGVSRRVLLIGASAAALTACAKPPVNIVKPTTTPGGSVADQLTAMMATYSKNTDKLGLAVRDLGSGKAWDYKGDYASQSASMAKVMIAGMTLRKARADGHELDFDHQSLLSNMLINSDNGSADKLWAYAGGADAYQALATALEMKSTHRDANRADWSWTWTTPKDQLVLLDKLMNGTPALTDADRLYELDVMRKTNPSQIWGVGHDRGDAVQVQMKNGWVQFGTGDFAGLWAVNSMGRVLGEGRNYTAAMMCRMPTFEIGKALLDDIGADLFRIMGTGQL